MNAFVLFPERAEHNPKTYIGKYGVEGIYPFCSTILCFFSFQVISGNNQLPGFFCIRVFHVLGIFFQSNDASRGRYYLNSNGSLSQHWTIKQLATDRSLHLQDGEIDQYELQEILSLAFANCKYGSYPNVLGTKICIVLKYVVVAAVIIEFLWWSMRFLLS